MSRDTTLVALSLIVNILSSVAIVFVNKQLVFRRAGFTFGCILTIIHFIATFMGCIVLEKMGYVEKKRLRLRSIFTISCAFCGYVVFNNLSLLHNSVTVYQMSKIICTPVIVFIEYIKYKNKPQKSIIVSLIVVCFGSSITVGSDTSLSVIGTLFCVLAIASNSLYTVWGKSMQHDLGVKPLQLLMYQAPVSAIMLTICSPALDNVMSLLAYKYTLTTFWSILLSCIFAFGINFSFFVFVGKTSALTMNVVGYFKTAMVFVVGYFLSTTEATFLNVTGTSVTLVGLALYSRIKYLSQKGD